MKSSIQVDDSYRIFRITKKQNDDSDDENIDGHHHMYILHKENNITSKPQRKSIKNSDRHGFVCLNDCSIDKEYFCWMFFKDGWKRKSTKNKRLLFLHKTSCDSTSNEAKIPSSPSQITTDLSPSINSVNKSNSICIFIDTQFDLCRMMHHQVNYLRKIKNKSRTSIVLVNHLSRMF